MKIDYPVLPSYGDNPTEEEKERTIASYYGHQNRHGFYPVGSSNTWHGGIHIEDFGTNVSAIADGRIIAYRIPEEYLHEKDNKDIKYSNGFILMQHQYTTPKGVALRFYSLYMHLQPKAEMLKNKGKSIPDLYAKYTTKVKTATKEIGLKVREYCKDHKTKDDAKEKVFVPKGSLIKKENITPPKGHWMENNTSYVFCSYQGEILIALKSWTTDHGKDYYQISHTKAKDKNTFNANAPKGTMVFDDINGTYIGMECAGTAIEIEKTKEKEWYKIKDKTQYVMVTDCEPLTKQIKDDVVFNDVQNVDMFIEAGQVIGVPSHYEANTSKGYTTAHIEVFTDDSGIHEFINNTQDNDRTSYEVAKEQLLQVGKPCNFLKADTKVKIYQTKDDYTQIGFESIKNIQLPVEGNIYTPNKNGSNGEKGYAIAPKGYYIYDFETVNEYFSNALQEGVSNITRMANGGSGTDPNRKVEYIHPKAGKKYWIKTSEVTGEAGNWVTLSQDISVVYEQQPTADTADSKAKKTAKIRKKATTKDSANTEWWLIKTKDNEQGWVKKSDLTKKNPYHWADYGWEILEDTGNQYFYMFGEYVEKSEPHDFIKKIWELADSDGDKELSNYELQQAVSTKDTIDILSKLICKHQSEWNTWANISDFEQELIDVHKKGINEAKGTDDEGNDLKQKLEQQRDAKIEMFKDKIKHLCFWQDIKNGEIVPMQERKQAYIDSKYNPARRIFPKGTSATEILLGKEFDELEKERDKRQFPTDSNVYHLHAIGFIEQMKMIVKKYGIRSGYSIGEAVKKLQENVKPKPIGQCGRYVRYALEAGYGLERDGLLGKTPGAAKDYDTYLTKKKFYLLENISDLEDYKPIKGDIAVFVAFQGAKKFHQYGHIQMYDGEKWISDFTQRGFWAGGDYRKFKPSFKIYRW
ncbi:GW dipeptide domain-containing protein [Aquimarina longa]|uniref:GW dipeptide domain-containing protein n=1 Tax=Aquimarina longa TaxID=1080221 RepID=UPI000785345E|nr:GW dipeptide domain-containing protein [Aquimarina longa]